MQYTLKATAQHFSKYDFLWTVWDIFLKLWILKFGHLEHSEMVKISIRDDRLPMHVSHVQLFDFSRENTCTWKILIFDHVVIIYIENNIFFSNTETNMVRVFNMKRAAKQFAVYMLTIHRNVYVEILYKQNIIIDKIH